RTFESLDDLAGYLGYRQNMLMYWNPARHVVLAEVIETQYQPTNGHPILRHRGSVIRSYKGDWLEGDTIRFVTATEGRPDWFTLSDLVIHDPPRMQILFLEERTDAEIFVD